MHATVNAKVSGLKIAARWIIGVASTDVLVCVPECLITILAALRVPVWNAER